MWDFSNICHKVEYGKCIKEVIVRMNLIKRDTDGDGRVGSSQNLNFAYCWLFLMNALSSLPTYTSQAQGSKAELGASECY